MDFPLGWKILSSSSTSQKFEMPTQISGNFEDTNLYLYPSIPNKETNDKENKNIDLETYINRCYF